MKTRTLWAFNWRTRPRLIACWGEARLLRWPDGRYRLQGGSPADRQAALEWVSFFLHEALLIPEPGQAPRPAAPQDGPCH